MARKTLRILLFVALGVSLGFGVGYLKLRSERKDFDTKEKALDRKVALLQKKYSEEKARASALLRTKVA